MTRRATDRFWAVVLLWLVVGAAAFAIAAGAIDGEGRQPRNHPGSVPAEVVALTKSAYIAPSESYAGRLCARDYNANGGLEFVTDSRSLRPRYPGAYIVCKQEQTWNATGPVSINFAHAAERVFRAAWIPWSAVVVLALAIFWMPLVFKERARVKGQKKRDHVTIEQQRKELRLAYANDEIGPETFERKLQELLERE